MSFAAYYSELIVPQLNRQHQLAPLGKGWGHCQLPEPGERILVKLKVMNLRRCQALQRISGVKSA